MKEQDFKRLGIRKGDRVRRIRHGDELEFTVRHINVQGLIVESTSGVWYSNAFEDEWRIVKKAPPKEEPPVGTILVNNATTPPRYLYRRTENGKRTNDGRNQYQWLCYENTHVWDDWEFIKILDIEWPSYEGESK